MGEIAFFLLGLLAWFVALLGPPFLALWFWRSVNERMKAWLAHILFLPCAILIEWIAGQVIFFANHDDGQGPPGLGIILILPLAMFVGSIAVYYLAVGWEFLRYALRVVRRG